MLDSIVIFVLVSSGFVGASARPSPFFGPGFARAAGGASGELSFSGRGLMDEGDINAVPSNVTESTGPSVSLTAVVMTWAVLCVLGLLFIAWYRRGDLCGVGGYTELDKQTTIQEVMQGGDAQQQTTKGGRPGVIRE